MEVPIKWEIKGSFNRHTNAYNVQAHDYTQTKLQIRSHTHSYTRASTYTYHKHHIQMFVKTYIRTHIIKDIKQFNKFEDVIERNAKYRLVNF